MRAAVMAWPAHKTGEHFRHGHCRTCSARVLLAVPNSQCSSPNKTLPRNGFPQMACRRWPHLAPVCTFSAGCLPRSWRRNALSADAQWPSFDPNSLYRSLQPGKPLQHQNSWCSWPNNWSSSPNSRCRSPNRPWRSLCSPSRPSRPFPSYPHRRHQLPAALWHTRANRAQLRPCCRTCSPSSSALRIRRCPLGVRGHFNLRAHRGRPRSSPSRRPRPRSSPW